LLSIHLSQNDTAQWSKPMTDRFATLTKACGGALTVETLTEFQKAMREYEVFMSGMRELLAPLPNQQERDQ
jgi:hypothetical protein